MHFSVGFEMIMKALTLQGYIQLENLEFIFLRIHRLKGLKILHPFLNFVFSQKIFALRVEYTVENIMGKTI